MAILAIVSGKGLTKQMYEDLRKDVRWEQDIPQGVILHAASFDDSGNIHVADIWESKERMNDFFNTRLIPVMQKKNMPAPQVEMYSVYNINASSAIDGYKIK
jgi:hypothetical protein